MASAARNQAAAVGNGSSGFATSWNYPYDPQEIKKNMHSPHKSIQVK
jgi:hypothetical protein